MKTIWIIDHYSSEPKYGGISRQYDFAKELGKRGYNVVVFSSSFSHYSHTYISDGLFLVSEPFDNVKYVYVKTRQYRENNGKDRALNMISFMINVLRVAPKIASKIGKPDVIEGASVHPLAWIAAYRLSRRYKVRFVAEVRDFWPQFWIDSGEKKANDPMCVFFQIIENFICKRADHIIYSLSHGDRYLCDQKGVKREKLTFIGQPMDCERYDQNSKRFAELPADVKDFISDGFICTFTGYYMEYEGVMVMLEAQKTLQNQGIETKMLFLGGGEAKAKMIKYVESNAIKNVFIGDRISKELVPAVLANSDVCMAHMEYPGKETVFKYGISKNKINDYLYSGACIIFGFRYDDNEVSNSEGGILFKPFDSIDMAEKLKMLYNTDKNLLREYGIKARSYAKSNHDAKILTDKLVSALFDKN